MSEDKQPNISTEPYKGVRDFYPEDMHVFTYVLDTMRQVAEQYGYLEYNASVLEPAELYEIKTGEEIVNEQMYAFTDRGDRRVALRPEMTPTVARMVAKRRFDFGFPVRLYSIPNVFRYERPQRGRLREHWQLNADLFGADSLEADYEIIALAHSVMTAFGASEEDFNICISSRALLESIYDHFDLSDQQRHAVSHVLDKKGKISADDFVSEMRSALGDKQSCTDELTSIIDANTIPDAIAQQKPYQDIEQLRTLLTSRGVTNVTLDISIVRGFDYYTGSVFEVFDTHPENNRSLFGGGRYDNLLDIFDAEPLPAVGFGMGDVTIRDFLTAHDLLPEYTATTDLFLCTVNPSAISFAQELAGRLRAEHLNVEVNVTDKKVGDQIKVADKHAIPYVICVGEGEMESRTYTIKELATGHEKHVAEDDIVDVIFAS